MENPYIGLPKTQYWRTAVGDLSPFQIEGLWSPKFKINQKTKIVTAGSCFAQHIGRALSDRGYRWVDAEPAPKNMTDRAKNDYHYGTFSFRTGNIYTTKMLSQWVNWACGKTKAPEAFWLKGGRYFDPFRPAVEPDGFVTTTEMYRSRNITIAAMRNAIEQADVFIFTLGLTEAWQDKEADFEYAVCPGTIAGEFDPDKHVFINHGYSGARGHLRNAIKIMQKINPNIKILLTVSPVPLTATATGEHVLTATSHSKSILRAVAGDASSRSRNIDYFPSYEIITHPAFRGMFYAPNQRSIDSKGVEIVMGHFFRDQQRAFSKTHIVKGPYGVEREVSVDANNEKPTSLIEDSTPFVADDIRCEEEMLDAFSKS